MPFAPHLCGKLPNSQLVVGAKGVVVSKSQECQNSINDNKLRQEGRAESCSFSRTALARRAKDDLVAWLVS